MSRPVLGATLAGPRVTLVAADDRYQVVRTADHLPVGTVVLKSRGSALFVESLVVAPEHRGFGAGSGAAALVREAAERGPWRRLQGCAPSNAGLAVYFWFRMGLRPLAGDLPEGGLLFERDVTGSAHNS